MGGLSLQDCWVSRITAFNACSALVLLVWDWVVCLDQEITWIWPQPPSTMSKWVYLFCRYAALGCKLFDITFVWRMEQHAPFHVSSCRLWLTYQGIVVEIFLAIIEGLLMVRVYALWGRSRRMCLVLATCLLLEMSSSAVSTAVIMGDVDFRPLCLFKKPPLLFVLFSVLALITQFFIFFLSVYNQRPLRCLRQPRLVTLVVMQGSVVSFTICALLIAGFVYLVLDTEYGNVMFYWVVSILSVCGCRLVLSVHRFSSSDDDDDHTPPLDDVCFTSICVIEHDPGGSS